MIILDKLKNMINPFNKKIEEINVQQKEKDDNHNKDYEAQATKAIDDCNTYNALVGLINAERYNMRDEINELADFFNSLGYEAEYISPLNFGLESFRNLNVKKVESVYYDQVNSTNLFGLKSRLLEATESSQRANESRKRSIDEITTEKSFLNLAKEIAKIYLPIVALVKDAIKKTLLPELNGIQAFLYAAAVVDAIANDEEPTSEICANEITEYENHPLYHQHYLLFKNAKDYYTLIKSFFERAVLTNILNDPKTAENEKDNFEKEAKVIKEKLQEIEAVAAFRR